jgi:hypothetical protein
VNKGVPNGTVLPPAGWHHSLMSSNKIRKPSHQAILAGVKKEMAKPRVARSAKIEVQRRRSAKFKEAAKL